MAWAWHGPLCMISLVFECCKIECGEVSVFDIVHKFGEGQRYAHLIKVNSVCDTCIVLGMIWCDDDHAMLGHFIDVPLGYKCTLKEDKRQREMKSEKWLKSDLYLPLILCVLPMSQAMTSLVFNFGQIYA